MTQNLSIAAKLNPEQRKKLFLEMQSSDQTITAIADREGVSRKFLHQQRKKGYQALEKGFNQTKEESDILYWMPVTKEWIFQVILALKEAGVERQEAGGRLEGDSDPPLNEDRQI